MAENLKAANFLQDAVSTTIGGDVANNGTFTIAYPTGRKAADYVSGPGTHFLLTGGATYAVSAGKATLAFGSSNITVTWKGGRTLAAGSEVRIGLIRAGSVLASDVDDAPAGVVPLSTHLINFGPVATSDDDALFAVELLAEAGEFTLPSGGVTFDVPRNVILTGATTNHSARTITVTGTDVNGDAIIETMAGPNDGIVAGKKAFKTVTSVASDGAIATDGIKGGFGDVLGLPFFVANAGFFLKALVDGVDELANCTIVGALATGVSTATSADVNGTIDFNTASNGTKVFQAIVLGGTKQPSVPQYVG